MNSLPLITKFVAIPRGTTSIPIAFSIIRLASSKVKPDNGSLIHQYLAPIGLLLFLDTVNVRAYPFHAAFFLLSETIYHYIRCKNKDLKSCITEVKILFIYCYQQGILLILLVDLQIVNQINVAIV